MLISYPKVFRFPVQAMADLCEVLKGLLEGFPEEPKNGKPDMTGKTMTTLHVSERTLALLVHFNHNLKNLIKDQTPSLTGMSDAEVVRMAEQDLLESAAGAVLAKQLPADKGKVKPN